jgi:hypothetical protein
MRSTTPTDTPSVERKSDLVPDYAGILDITSQESTALDKKPRGHFHMSVSARPGDSVVSSNC